MQVSQFLTRPRAVLGLAFFGLLPLAWQASGATPKHAMPHTTLRARIAPRSHGTLRPHSALRPHAAGQPATAIPLYTFPGKPDGARALSRLIQAGDGNFYGVTRGGGSGDRGSAFRMTPDGTVTTLDSFGQGTQGTTPAGAFPGGPLVEGLNADGTPNGVFFGTTIQGGDNNAGTIYMLAPDAGRATKYAISYLYLFTGGADGGTPLGGLAIGRKADGTPDGYLYGTATTGGAISASNNHGLGVVFHMTTNGFVESVLYTFPDLGTGNINQGDSPQGTLIQSHDASGWGKFFGTTSDGGAGGYGTVFSITSAGKLVMLHDFPFTTDGYDPVSGLTQGADGTLYGTTFYGGIALGGTVYRLVPDAKSSTGYTYSQVVSLDYTNANPQESVIQASDGKLYGTSEAGGGGTGSVFRVDADPNSPTGFSATQIFTPTDPTTQGQGIFAGVTQGTDGDLYGATATGGSGNAGTIYRLNVGAPSTIKSLSH